MVCLVKFSRRDFLHLWSIIHILNTAEVTYLHISFESILTNCISVWYGNCSVNDKKAPESGEICSTYHWCPALNNHRNPQKNCVQMVRGFIKKPSHSCHGLFTLLPSGKCYKGQHCHTSWLRNSFLPSAVTLLNSTRHYSHTLFHTFNKLHILDKFTVTVYNFYGFLFNLFFIIRIYIYILHSRIWSKSDMNLIQKLIRILFFCSQWTALVVLPHKCYSIFLPYFYINWPEVLKINYFTYRAIRYRLHAYHTKAYLCFLFFIIIQWKGIT